jgi:uncharacterized phage-like protein YoqJ
MTKNKTKKKQKINNPSWVEKVTPTDNESYVLNEKETRKNVDKYLIWHIQGGLGKNVAATSILPHLKEKYNDRKLIVVAAWPEIFLNNLLIDRLYAMGSTSHFYDDYINNKDTIMFRHEAYNQTAHINKSQHLIHNWCDLMELEYSEEKYNPMIVLNYAQQQLPQRWDREKPTMVLHTNGGPFTGQKFSYNWARDMPHEIAQRIVEQNQEKYHIFQICRQDSFIIEGVERIDQQMSGIELFSLLATSTKRVLIDSCMQHAAAAFGLQSTVLWIGTSPTVFGYNIHKNIVAKETKIANQRIGSYMFDYQFDNNIHECPYITYNDMFDVNHLLRNI